MKIRWAYVHIDTHGPLTVQFFKFIRKYVYIYKCIFTEKKYCHNYDKTYYSIILYKRHNSQKESIQNGIPECCFIFLCSSFSVVYRYISICVDRLKCVKKYFNQYRNNTTAGKTK